MNLPEKYYREKLYPFQDGVLKIVKESGIPCYLTGGTALSRGYFEHRYSDDLDLFMNRNPDYGKYVQTLLRAFESAESSGMFSIDRRRMQKYEHFAQFFLVQKQGDESVELKIDIVNDIAAHFDGFEQHDILGKIDSWQNILSNKIAAVYRYEPKDIADIWVISKNRSFDWVEIIEQAKEKEAGIEPVEIFNVLRSFPKDALSLIKWAIPIDADKFISELNQIAGDIFRGNKN